MSKNKIIISKIYKEKSKILFSFILQTILLIQLYPNKNSYYHNLYLYLFIHVMKIIIFCLLSSVLLKTLYLSFWMKQK